MSDYEYIDSTPTTGGWLAFLGALAAEVDYLAGEDEVPATFSVAVDSWSAGTVRHLVDHEEEPARVSPEPLDDEQTAALVALHIRPDPGTTPGELVAALLGASLSAQLDEPSDDEARALSVIYNDEGFAMFEDLAACVRAAVEQRMADWLDDGGYR